MRRLEARRLEKLATEIAGIVRDGQDRGEINRDLDPVAVARVLLAIIQGLIVQRVAQPGKDFAAYQEVVQAIVSGNFKGV